jgi:hypothetical protein
MGHTVITSTRCERAPAIGGESCCSYQGVCTQPSAQKSRRRAQIGEGGDEADRDPVLEILEGELALNWACDDKDLVQSEKSPKRSISRLSIYFPKGNGRKFYRVVKIVK